MDPRRRSLLRGKVRDASAADVTTPPRPPWSRPEQAFLARCTRCDACITACPQTVLKRGDGGFPQIDFSRNGCSLCGDCARACPTGAIDPVAVPLAFRWRIQVADSCLARRGVECRVCGDACDARALRFVPARGGIAQLQVDAAACTGCGECLPVCPVAALSLR
jgi:ferredoxin-type protein NapF